jgi:hypothetical protein
MEIDVAILTKSAKHGGYCVSGVDIHSGNLIRLLSEDKYSHGALFDKNMKYENNISCKPLDIVKVSIIKNPQTKYQPENMLVDTNRLWRKIDEITLSEVLKLHPPENHMFILGDKERCISKDIVQMLEHSLILIEVNQLAIIQEIFYDRISGIDRTKQRAYFSYKTDRYMNISITDQDFFCLTSTKKIDKAVLIMSLPDEPFREKYYKLIAKIFPL